jgi:hypothetical protein
MKRLRFILILLAAVVLGCTAVFTWAEKEPSYQGKTITEWLFQRELIRGVDQDYYVWTIGEKSVAAIEAIGTNALPTLLRMMASHDGAVKSKLINLLNSQSLVHLWLHTAEDRRRAAFYGFVFLGTNALPAVPALIALTKNKNWEVRACALRSLVEFHVGETTLLPVLTDLQSDSDTRVQMPAAGYLARLYPDEAERLGIYTKSPQLARFRSLNSSTNAPAASK